MEKQIGADTQYAVGAFDALAGLLGIIAKHQRLNLKGDLDKLLESSNVFHSELEAHRLNGYTNTINSFTNEFR